jgi:DNA polymerase-3 subunit delta
MDQYLTLQRVLTDIDKGKISPCYLLYGEEDYLIKTALEKIVSRLLPEAIRDINLLVLEGTNEAGNRLCETLRTPPLVPGRKVIVLKDARLLYSRQSTPELVRRIRESIDRDPAGAVGIFLVFIRMAGLTINDLKDGNWKSVPEDEWRRLTGEETEEREAWLPRLIELCSSQGLEIEPVAEEDAVIEVLSRGMPDSNYLVIATDIVDRRKKLFKVISEKGVVLQFQQTKIEARQQNQIQGVAREWLGKKGKDIESKALLALGRKTGFDLRRSMAELEKLVAFTGEKSIIEEADVCHVVGKTKEVSVFDMTAALVERDLSGALYFLGKLLDQGIHHLVILSMIIREFRFLLHAKVLAAEGRIADLMRLPDYGRFQKVILPILKEMSARETDRLDLLKQHPYVIFNAVRFSEKFSRQELIDKLEYLHESDLSFKVSGQDPRLLMEHLIIRLCRPPHLFGDNRIGTA